MHVFQGFVKIKPIHCIASISVIFVIFYLNNTSYIKKTELQVPGVTGKPNEESTTETKDIKRHNSEMKYILLWTDSNKSPFVYFGEGNSLFKKKKCKYTNCFVTSNRELLRDHSEYDIVAFNGPQLGKFVDKPSVRSIHQKYVYTNIEAAVNYPICDSTWDEFFNWTWTYKLNSDAIWGYVAIKNSSGHIIGPKINMDWISVDEMEPIDNDLKLSLATKTKAAAWFVSNCETSSKREEFVSHVKTFMKTYKLDVDIYGACGTFQCPKAIMKHCHGELQRNYYFYFAFENSLSEDYVTEKILHALNHYTVPVVFGGADYSRFLPPGSYINAHKLGPSNLAKELYDIIENPQLYYRFFRWKKYYSYQRRNDGPDTDDYCRFCAMANDKYLMNEYTTYLDLSAWWTPDTACPSDRAIENSE